MNRRDFLVGSAVAGAGLASARYGFGQKQEPLPELKDLAAAVGLKYGSDSDAQFAQQPAAYSELFTRQCALYAPIFLWSDPNRRAGTQPWEDPNIGFARAHKLKLTGGHIVWHQETPKWLGDMTPKAAESAILRHTAELGLRYGNDLYSWNVVNEAIEPYDKQSDGLRKTVYEKDFGLDYFDFTAHAAMDAVPGALRVYNDYGMEMDTDECEQRRRALIWLMDEFKKRNTPIQAIGLQTHIRLDGGRFDEKVYGNLLKEISDRGFLIMITEMDVLDLKTPASIAVRDQTVADIYSRLLNTALANQAMKAVVTWGLVDRYTWLTPRTGPQFARSDGQPSRPLLFDDDYKPKPSFWAVVNAFKHAPKRQPA